MVVIRLPLKQPSGVGDGKKLELAAKIDFLIKNF